MVSFIIAGLGNDAAKYRDTRHNIGFSVVEALASEYAGTWGTTPQFSLHRKTGVHVYEVRVGSPGASALTGLIVKPTGFINECGPKIASICSYYSLSPSQLVVVHDDLEQDFGQMSLVYGGGERGHNGTRSVTKALGTPYYERLRVGIGRPPGRMPVANYVLQRFNGQQRDDVPFVCADAVDALNGWVRGRS